VKLQYIHSNNLEPHDLAVYEFGNPSNHAVVLLHAFTHNGLFFKHLAEYLANKGFYVICPDMPGRGKSSYLTSHKNYNYHLYVDDLFLILNFLKVETSTILGSSMGGITSILFTEKYPKMVKKIILNDIGVVAKSEESMRIGSHVGKGFSKPSKGEMMKRIDEELLQSNLKHNELEYIFDVYALKDDLGYSFNYDINIGKAFWIGDKKIKIPDLDFSENFSLLAKTCKWLDLYVIRGAKSNLLDNNNFKMLKSCKQFRDSMEIPNKGHLPLFFTDQEKDIIASWLNS
jgi:pimeloyl-ACP methyl ester carboxylesterase